MTLAHVDGIRYGKIIDDACTPEVLITLLCGQAVVECGQAGALKGRACQYVIAQHQAAARRETAQRVTCAPRNMRSAADAHRGE